MVSWLLDLLGELLHARETMFLYPFGQGSARSRRSINLITEILHLVHLSVSFLF